MRKWISGVIFVISIVLLAISLYFLMGMFRQEQKDNQVYEEITAIYEQSDTRQYESSVEDETDAWDKLITEIQPKEDERILALQQENPDCIGWLTIDGTAIDYPVMYRPPDINYYLRRDFYGNYSVNGSLFLSELCDPADSDNLIIYGHHMKSGKMFADLEKYKKKSFYEEHPQISFRTLYGEQTYQIISVFCTQVHTENDFPYYRFGKAANEKEYEQFVDECTARALYDTGIHAEYGDKLLTLSTCEYSRENGRLVVVAKHINKTQEGSDVTG